MSVLCVDHVPLNPILRESDERWTLQDLEATLRNAIGICARSDERDREGEIFMALSGGLDSSLCLALTRDELGRQAKIHTFTIGRSEDHPDIVHARLVAKLFNTIHHEYIPSSQDITDAAEETITNYKLFINDSDEGMGGIGVFLLLRYVARQREHSSLIVHDGIDELLGGYWPHRQEQSPGRRLAVFNKFWGELPQKHLAPLLDKGHHFYIHPSFPYLQRAVIRYITAIPLEERTSKAESKIPLRRIAEKYLPREIIERPKIGFCDALKEF
jgi:asparagine synthase (glutamine-hydrolysing)